MADASTSFSLRLSPWPRETSIGTLTSNPDHAAPSRVHRARVLIARAAVLAAVLVADWLFHQCRRPPDRQGAEILAIANVRSGKDYLMENVFYAGGLRALMKQFEDRLDLTAPTVTGRSMGGPK